MNLSCIHEGQRRIYTFDLDEVTVGRTTGKDDPHLRLDFDLKVSRLHARFYREDGRLYVEDLASLSGVFVNHARIQAPFELKKGDVVRIGNTRICLETPSDSVYAEAGKPAEVFASVPPTRPAKTQEGDLGETVSDRVRIHEQADAWHRALFFARVMGEEFSSRLKRLYDLPVEFAEIEARQELFEKILRRAIEITPGAERGALLSFETASGKLRLQCSHPGDHPPVSRRLVKKAAGEGAGLIWSHRDGQTLRAGIYAPIIWRKKVIGMLCVDSPGLDEVFDEVDLRMLVAVAHYAAAALALRHWLT